MNFRGTVLTPVSSSCDAFANNATRGHIHKVLSRPTKVAMPMLLHKERAPIHHQGLELLAEDTAPSNVQPRETRAGIKRGKLYATAITDSQRFYPTLSCGVFLGH